MFYGAACSLHSQLKEDAAITAVSEAIIAEHLIYAAGAGQSLAAVAEIFSALEVSLTRSSRRPKVIFAQTLFSTSNLTSRSGPEYVSASFSIRADRASLLSSAWRGNAVYHRPKVLQITPSRFPVCSSTVK